MPPTRRNRTEVSCVIKYLVFGFNGLFWLLGAALTAIGVWAWSEKDVFANLSKVSRVPDPALFFIIIGFALFWIGKAGCVGALRENICLLSCFAGVIGFLFAVQVIIGILAFAYKDWVAQQAKDQLKNMLVLYREDEDLQNIIDWVQGDWLKCCGVDDYNDWNDNEYFNCSSPSVEKCGVPFSCCKFADEDVIKNTQCGFGVRENKQGLINRIYVDGCLVQGGKWLNKNLIPVAGVVVAIALLQILGICFALNLRGDIQAQIAKWR